MIMKWYGLSNMKVYGTDLGMSDIIWDIYFKDVIASLQGQAHSEWKLLPFQWHTLYIFSLSGQFVANRQCGQSNTTQHPFAFTSPRRLTLYTLASSLADVYLGSVVTGLEPVAPSWRITSVNFYAGRHLGWHGRASDPEPHPDHLRPSTTTLDEQVAAGNIDVTIWHSIHRDRR